MQEGVWFLMRKKWHYLLLMILLTLSPGETEGAWTGAPAKSNRQLAAVARRFVYIRVQKNRSARRLNHWFRQVCLRCNDIQYRQRGIWTIPRQFQSDTF
ncbi:hypothetical protein CHM34_09565 [Paludifilum halophilum]|uniref:Uncharacterized protein n=1 Tax=Paludifilum halophilum TaxID=1642702 RepID=A0A235B5Z0_9BACL|nr:hypothetical protein CHM34_09565 [Paludifilum halophilum]